MGSVHNSSGQVLAGSIITSAGVSSDSGAGITTGNAWAARGTGSDGDWQQVTEGGTFRYHSTLGWVRPFVYAGTIVLDNRIDGDTEPASETAAWTDTTGGSGAISSDGTHVSWDSSGAAADYDWSEFDHGTTDADHYMTGQFTVTGEIDANVGAPFGRGFQVRTGSRNIGVTFSYDEPGTRFMRFTTATGPVIANTSNDDLGFATEAWIELYVAGSQVTAYHDHGAQPILSTDLANFPAIAHTIYKVGDGTTQGAALMKGRNILCGRF